MESINYFKQRTIETNKKIKQQLFELPEFVAEFFIGIESRTSVLTRLNYAGDLKTFFSFLANEIDVFKNNNIKTITLSQLNKLTSTHLEQYLSYLNGYDKSGKMLINEERGKARKLSSVRSMLKYFFKKGKLNANVGERVEMPKIHEKEIVRLEIDEVVKLLDVAESGTNLTNQQQNFHKHTQLRDVAILTLLLGTGIRVSECVGLNVSDIDFSLNGFKITRKGGNSVVLYFGEEIENTLKDYLRWREQNKELQDEPALFCSLQNKRIGVRTVEKLVKKYAEIVTPLKKITPHKLRSTYGTNLYRETKDIYIVADVLGHKDVNTTKKHYAAQSDDIRREAANVVKLRK